MKAADLRAIVEQMTDAPWFARGRFLSRDPRRGVGHALQESVGRLLELREFREMQELIRSLEFYDRNTNAPVEAADVIIVLMRMFERMGTDWQVEVDKKMAINRARKWVLDGEGHGSHVKETI